VIRVRILECVMSNHIGGSPVDHDGPRGGDRIAMTGAMKRLGARLGRLLHADRGVAAVEFGLAAPIMLAALVPAADLGIAFSQQQRLQQAVQAGAQYAATQIWGANSPAAITAVVTAATSLSGVTVSPAPYRICGCPNGGGVSTVACGSTCGQGQNAGSYVVISAQRPYTPVLPYSLLGASRTLSAQAMVRVQ
jgi:Flp pilus assembly protein TadG